MRTTKVLSDFLFTEKRGFALENFISITSQLFHLFAFGCQKPKQEFNSAMLIFSVDIDAGSEKLGLINNGKNDLNVHKCFSEAFIGNIEKRALPRIIEVFSNFEIPATFAVRGQIIDVDSSVLELLLDSPVKHDIGAHGYSHRDFKTMTKLEAEKELINISLAFKKFDIVPKSFVFPRNIIRHLDLLEKFGYKCYREGTKNFLKDGMYIEKKGELFNIQPSLYLDQCITPFILEKILDMAVLKKAPLHLWLHPWSFGHENEFIEKYVQEIISPFLRHAQTKKTQGVLTFETMVSAAKKAETAHRSKECS